MYIILFKKVFNYLFLKKQTFIGGFVLYVQQ